LRKTDQKIGFAMEVAQFTQSWKASAISPILAISAISLLLRRAPSLSAETLVAESKQNWAV
jgi:hypothetical protein